MSSLIDFIGDSPLYCGFSLLVWGMSGLILFPFLLAVSSLTVIVGVRLSAEFSLCGASLIIGGSLILCLALYLYQ